MIRTEVFGLKKKKKGVRFRERSRLKSSSDGLEGKKSHGSSKSFQRPKKDRRIVRGTDKENKRGKKGKVEEKCESIEEDKEKSILAREYRTGPIFG